MTISNDPIAADSPDLDPDEARMRRALALHGQSGKPDGRGHDLRAKASERPRARFVQDGDVPVTMLHRPRSRDTAIAAPSNSRLAAAEAALDSERSQRLHAERTLHAANATIRELQSRLSRLEIAHHDAQEALRSERQGREAAEAAELEARAAAVVQPAPVLLAPDLPKPARRGRPPQPRAEKAPKLREPKPIKWWLKP